MMTWQAKSLSWKERTHTSHRAFSDSAASTLREALPVELRKFVTGLTTHLNPFVRLFDLPGLNPSAGEALRLSCRVTD